MLSSIRFKLASAPSQPALEIQIPPSVTIFVGPNNSGKSQALREINDLFHSGKNLRGHIVEDITFSPLTKDEAYQELENISIAPSLEQSLANGERMIRVASDMHRINIETFVDSLQAPNERPYRESFATNYAVGLILALDGPSRIRLLDPQPRGDLKNPDSSFAQLLVDEPRRAALRKLVQEATGFQLVLDASVGDQLYPKFGKEPPPSERSLEDPTLEYMRSAHGANQVSDGIKAFAGILLQLHVGKPRVITVDEPEAFLHPSLAFTLGKELAKGAVDEGKHIFASTHSAQFLMGAISSGAEVNIVRLTYQDGVGTARLLPSAQLKILMQDPLLRSVGVLEGLFFDSVLVGEANADRAFYQEVNERLLAVNDPRGAPRVLFLNADNHQTVYRVVAPLRGLGIPCAAVVDIDVLKRGGAEWTRQLAAIGIPTGEYAAYSTRRDAVLQALNGTGKDYKRQGGINLLANGNLEMAQNLLVDLRRNGFFVVPHGEVEAWLADLDVERGKHAWLYSIFEKMGADPNSPGYVKPAAGDVWDFVGEIAAWMKNKDRRGIPV